MKALYRVCTVLILALGLLHISLTPLFFTGLTQNALWFASGGMVIIFVSFFNFILMSEAGRHRTVRILGDMANVLSLVFATLMLIIQSRRGAPGPTSWIVLALFVFETFAGFRYSAKTGIES